MSAYVQLAKIAARNIIRNKRRTMLSLMILVMGGAGLIIVGGYFNGLLIKNRETIIYSHSGHLQVNRKDYFKKGSTDPYLYMIEDRAKVQRAIESTPGVLYTVPRLKLGGMLSNDKASLSVIALGVDPVLEQRMVMSHPFYEEKLSANIVEGAELDGNDPNGILIGEALKEALGLSLGDAVTFITTRKEGAIDGAQFHVRGVFKTPLKDLGERIIKIPLAAAAGVFGVSGKIHSLLVILPKTEDTEKVLPILKKNLAALDAPLEVLDWRTVVEFHRQAEEFLNNLYRTLQLIISVIFLFSIANTINMALFERMREYGTMLAIGNSRWVVFAVILMEVGILGFLGSALGLGLGISLAKFLTWSHISIPPPPGSSGLSRYVMSIMTYPRLIVEVGLTSLFATFVSAAYPAYRASHMQIVRALGYV